MGLFTGRKMSDSDTFDTASLEDKFNSGTLGADFPIPSSVEEARAKAKEVKQEVKQTAKAAAKKVKEVTKPANISKAALQQPAAVPEQAAEVAANPAQKRKALLVSNPHIASIKLC